VATADGIDVLIAGGGPAGSTCAWKLHRAGLRVVICDRAAFPRDKVCAGWITPQVVAALDLKPSTYAAAGLTWQPIKGFRVSRQGDAEVRVVYNAPVSYGIRRCEFDDYLLRRSGADLQLGQPVRDCERVDGTWVVNGALRAPVLVGAGGHFCPVAQRLGAQLGNHEAIIAAHEAEFELSPDQQRACAVEPEVPEIFFTRDLKGYGWVFRKGRFINIGLGRQDTAKLAGHVAEFVAFLQQRRKIPPHLPAKFRGHAYLLYDQAQRPLVSDGALLIGDAAGLAYPKSGEGIRPAIESGLLAAETILEANGHYERARLAGYERRMTERFGPRAATWGFTDILPAWVTGVVAGRLFATNWFVRHVVLDRWFFHAQQSALRDDYSAFQSKH
jgi:geranylgeranyl reductase family protein